MSSPVRHAELDARIIELESRVAFQEELIAALEQVVSGLSEEMTHMRPAFGELRRRVDAVQVALAHDTSSEPPPPHY